MERRLAGGGRHGERVLQGAVFASIPDILDDVGDVLHPPTVIQDRRFDDAFPGPLGIEVGIGAEGAALFGLAEYILQLSGPAI